MGKPRDYEMTFAGAGEREIHATGKYVRVLDTPSADVFFSLDAGSELQRGAGQQIADSDPAGFTRVRVRTPVAQTVRFTVADVPQDDSRSNVALTVSATVAGATAVQAPPVVTVPPLASMPLVAANPDRIELRLALSAAAASHVWLGPLGVADEEGGLLEPGMIDYQATDAALYAYNPHATLSVDVSVMELERP